MGQPQHHQLGNQHKTLWLCLMNGHYANQATVTLAETSDDGFLGIREVRLTPEQRAAFDNGGIPTLNGFRQGGVTGRGFPFGYKALHKLWQSAGLVETMDGEGGVTVRFHAPTRERFRARALRADAHRREQQQTRRPDRRMDVASLLAPDYTSLSWSEQMRQSVRA